MLVLRRVRWVTERNGASATEECGRERLASTAAGLVFFRVGGGGWISCILCRYKLPDRQSRSRAEQKKVSQAVGVDLHGASECERRQESEGRRGRKRQRGNGRERGRNMWRGCGCGCGCGCV